MSLPGCCTAIQIAWVFITSFLLPMANVLTKEASLHRPDHVPSVESPYKASMPIRRTPGY
jgi:hypothetical protein